MPPVRVAISEFFMSDLGQLDGETVKVIIMTALAKAKEASASSSQLCGIDLFGAGRIMINPGLSLHFQIEPSPTPRTWVLNAEMCNEDD